MLEDIRQGAKGPMGKVLVIVISLAFGLWGVSTVVPLVFGGSAPITVNGERITEAEVAQRIAQERQAIFEQFGGQIDPSLLRDEFIRPQVINQMVAQRLISQAAAQHGFVLSDEGLNRILARQPAFQENGRFSSEVFSRIAARQGMTASQLRDQIGSNEVAQQWVNGLLLSEFVLSREIQLYGEYLHQTRSIDFLIFDPNDFRADVRIEDDAIQSFYDRESARFQTPERVSVEYVELTRDHLLSGWSPTSAELSEAYDRYVSQQQSQRDQFISHILISLETRSDEEALMLAQSLRNRADNEDFSVLAETYSDDPGSAGQGGVLGRFDANSFLPEFSAVMATLSEPGDVSDVFSTAFGYHIVKLDTITSANVLSFSEKEAELITQLAERYLSSRLPAIREELAALAFAALDLEPISQSFSVEVRQSPLFDRSGSDWSLANPEIIESAFSPDVLDEGLNSPVLISDDDRLLVLRRDRFESAQRIPLSEVKDDIIEELISEEMQTQAELSALNFLAELEDNPTLSADWQSLLDLSRFDASLPEPVIEEVFRVMAPESNTQPTPFISGGLAGSWVVGRVHEVTPGVPLMDEQELILGFLHNELGTDGIDGLLNHIQSEARIRIR